jgi:hypothetical protein
MSVKNKVWAKLKSQEWTTSGEFEDMFPKGTPGHMSWDQGLRDIRKEMVAKGGDVISRRKSGSTWEYKLLEPEPERTDHEAMLIHHNHTIETVINRGQAEFAGMGRVNYGV